VARSAPLCGRRTQVSLKTGLCFGVQIRPRPHSVYRFDIIDILCIRADRRSASNIDPALRGRFCNSLTLPTFRLRVRFWTNRVVTPCARARRRGGAAAPASVRTTVRLEPTQSDPSSHAATTQNSHSSYAGTSAAPGSGSDRGRQGRGLRRRAAYCHERGALRIILQKPGHPTPQLWVRRRPAAYQSAADRHRQAASYVRRPGRPRLTTG
jgi:hypothetical protein